MVVRAASPDATFSQMKECWGVPLVTAAVAHAVQPHRRHCGSPGTIPLLPPPPPAPGDTPAGVMVRGWACSGQGLM